MNKKLDSNELALWSQFVHELTGISLNEEKEYLPFDHEEKNEESEE